MRLNLRYNLKSRSMQPMEDENCEIEFEEIYNSNKSPEDTRFDQTISELQQIMIDPEFENSLTTFMAHHWSAFGETSPPQQQLAVFQEYRQQMRQYLQNKLRNRIANFEWPAFTSTFQSKIHEVDEQIMDTLMSLEDVESFKSYIKDYRKSYEEVETYKVLTVKSTKISENKKVKGKDSIFAGGNNLPPGLFDKPLKPLPKKKEGEVEKTEDELLVPDLILTVKPIRKA